MRLTKIYTRNGDKGNTRLADGTEIAKNALRLEAYGTVDELNAQVGVCREFLDGLSAEKTRQIDIWLEAIQNDLFNLGGDLATPIASRWPNMILIGDKEVTVLENLIDYCLQNLPPLKDFVLPGGSRINAFLHCARTICRRAERITVALQQQEEINPFAVTYLNRLSDLFFALCRWVQEQDGQMREVVWEKQKGVRNLL